MSEELKPCPFCGGKSIMNGYRFIFCSDCRAIIDHLCNQENGITAWNRRAEPEELPEWVKTAIRIEIGGLIEHLGESGYAEHTVDALNWVLSLRKPEDD